MWDSKLPKQTNKQTNPCEETWDDIAWSKNIMHTAKYFYWNNIHIHVHVVWITTLWCIIKFTSLTWRVLHNCVIETYLFPVRNSWNKHQHTYIDYWPLFVGHMLTKYFFSAMHYIIFAVIMMFTMIKLWNSTTNTICVLTSSICSMHYI